MPPPPNNVRRRRRRATTILCFDSLISPFFHPRTILHVMGAAHHACEGGTARAQQAAAAIGGLSCLDPKVENSGHTTMNVVQIHVHVVDLEHEGFGARKFNVHSVPEFWIMHASDLNSIIMHADLTAWMNLPVAIQRSPLFPSPIRPYGCSGVHINACSARAAPARLLHGCGPPAAADTAAATRSSGIQTPGVTDPATPNHLPMPLFARLARRLDLAKPAGCSRPLLLRWPVCGAAASATTCASPVHTSASSSLDGQTAIVTGGGSGIGQGIALGLAAEGVHVVVTGRRLEALQETVDQAAGLPGTVEAFAADISQRDQSALVSHVVSQHGRLDILVNNAGMNVPKRALAELTVDDWHSVIDTNLNGAFHVIHAALPQMRLQQDGLIIQITSISGKRTISTLAGAAYCASKFAQQSLGNAINLEEYENGIRCTNIAPGEVATAILDKRPVPPSNEKRAQMLAPPDIADAVVMVAKLPKVAHVTEIIMTGKTTVPEAVLCAVRRNGSIDLLSLTYLLACTLLGTAVSASTTTTPMLASHRERMQRYSWVTTCTAPYAGESGLADGSCCCIILLFVMNSIASKCYCRCGGMHKRGTILAPLSHCSSVDPRTRARTHQKISRVLSMAIPCSPLLSSQKQPEAARSSQKQPGMHAAKLARRQSKRATHSFSAYPSFRSGMSVPNSPDPTLTTVQPLLRGNQLTICSVVAYVPILCAAPYSAVKVTL
eukprot:47302_3